MALYNESSWLARAKVQETQQTKSGRGSGFYHLAFQILVEYAFSVNNPWAIPKTRPAMETVIGLRLSKIERGSLGSCLQRVAQTISPPHKVTS